MTKRDLDNNRFPIRKPFALNRLCHHAVYAAILSAVAAFPAMSSSASNDFIVYSGQSGSVSESTFDNTLTADLLITAGQTFNFIGRTPDSLTLTPETPLDGIFNTHAIKDFSGFTVRTEVGSSVLIRGG